jgi:arylformamidase
MNLHTGTHMDAPLHMLENGDTVENTALGKMITKVRVLDLTGLKDGITAEDLRDKGLQNGIPVLFKTRNSYEEGFNPDFIYLKKSGAELIASLEIPVVGIDSPGIERSQPGHETHKTLMGAGCVIIEGLRLADVDEGGYKMYALPLKIRGAEGAPARVLLSEE